MGKKIGKENVFDFSLGNPATPPPAKFGESVNSPYSSENVLGVYGYSKAVGGTGAGGSVSWQDVYAPQLNRWRKVAFL